jgi:hypothetical protein
MAQGIGTLIFDFLAALVLGFIASALITAMLYGCVAVWLMILP